MRIVVSRRCWIDPETGEVIQQWFELFLHKARSAYPEADITVQETGRCIAVYAGDSEEEWRVERHLTQLSVDTLFEWARESEVDVVPETGANA
jgi:hypothetical protein